jgi:hypothetical protein
MLKAVENALKALATSLPGVAREMRHDEESGSVLQTSSVESTDSVSEDSPTEAVRFIATASDFPTLAKGDVVEIGNDYHLVVSTKIDPLGASLSFSASKSLNKIVATYSGKRNEGGIIRKITNPVETLVSQVEGLPGIYGEAAAPSYAQGYIVCIAKDSWLELSAPQISDALEFLHPDKPFETLHLRVASVVEHSGWWMLKARPRGGA